MTRGAESVCFRFGPGLSLAASGDRASLRHLAREYGAARVAPGAEPDVELEFGRLSGEREHFAGSHKSVSWRVRLEPPGGRPLRGSIELRGRPRGVARSLVQGYVVEALLGVAAARRGVVLLPAAALEEDGGALILLGRSRSGKSSLMARALAARRTVLGDDQVLIDEVGRCWAFPRRMRIYPDLRLTAPDAYRRLRSRTRLPLAARRAARIASRGYVGPSLALPHSELGAPPPSEPLALRALVLLERDRGGDRIERHTLGSDEAMDAARATIAEQRTHLMAGSVAWADELRAAEERELATLAGALHSVRLERVSVPDALGAAAAVQGLAELLGVER